MYISVYICTFKLSTLTCLVFFATSYSEAYERSTGRTPYLFQGSSLGAVAFNHLRVQVLP
jgi:hypothetical protein